MSKKVIKDTKTKKISKEIWIAIIFGCITIGIVIGILISSFIRGKGLGWGSSRINGGEIVDYQEKGLITLGEYLGLAMSLDVTDEDVKSEIESLLEEYAEYEHLRGPVKDGDNINIDFEGKINNVPFEGGTEEDCDLEVGAGEFIDGFDEQIVGMNPGETKDIKVTFPLNYGDDALNGKEAVFTITLNYIAGEQLGNEFDDVFVQRISDGAYTTADEYKEHIKQYLRADNEESKADTYWDLVLENVELNKIHSGEYNKALKETKAMYTNFADASDITVEELLEQFGMTREDLESTATDMALDRMTARTIAKLQNIQMTDEYYRAALLKALEYEDDPETTVISMEEDYLEGYAADPKDDMLVQQVKDYLAETAVIK